MAVSKSQIFLCFEHPSGTSSYKRLTRDDGQPYKCYLPDTMDSRDVELSPVYIPASHSIARLEVHEHYVLLDFHKGSPDGTHVISDRGTPIRFPQSNQTNRYTVVLQDGTAFVTPAGQWKLEFDDDQGSLSNSMHPPPLPANSPPDTNSSAGQETDQKMESNEVPIGIASPSTAIPANADGDDNTVEFSPSSPGIAEKYKYQKFPGPPLTTAAIIATSTSVQDAVNENSITPPKIKRRRSSVDLELTRMPSSARKKSRTPSIEKTLEDSITVKFEGQSDSSAAEDDGSPKAASPSSLSSQQSPIGSRPSPLPSLIIDRPAVCFSSGCTVPDRRPIMIRFAKLGAKIVDKVQQCHVFCVPKQGLRKSADLILAVIYGRHIVTEDWVLQSSRDGTFADCLDHVPVDKTHEREWGFSLERSLRRNRQEPDATRSLLAGYSIHLTPALRDANKELEADLKRVASALGAKSISNVVPTKVSALTSYLVVGTRSDPHYQQVVNLGLPIFSKEILTISALRGRLVQGEEFRIG